MAMVDMLVTFVESPQVFFDGFKALTVGFRYVCMHVCMYVCMHMYVGICRRVQGAHGRFLICMYESKYVCMYVCLYAYIYGYFSTGSRHSRKVSDLYVCIYVCVCMYLCMYLCMHVYGGIFRRVQGAHGRFQIRVCMHLCI